MTNAGLQQRAIVFAISPENRYRGANVGLSEFLGTVSAMNEHGLAFGEMGGLWPGVWDGKPKSFLIRGMKEQCIPLKKRSSFCKTARELANFFI